MKLLIRESVHTSKIYLISKHKTLPNGVIQALKKHDITEEFLKLESYRRSRHGGLVRAQRLSQARRSEIAKKASKARWRKKKA